MKFRHVDAIFLKIVVFLQQHQFFRTIYIKSKKIPNHTKKADLYMRVAVTVLNIHQVRNAQLMRIQNESSERK